MNIEQLTAMMRAAIANPEEASLVQLTRALARSGYYRPHLEGRMRVQLMGHDEVIGPVEEVTYLGVQWLKVVRDDGTWVMHPPQSVFALEPHRKMRMTIVHHPNGSISPGPLEPVEGPARCDDCGHGERQGVHDWVTTGVNGEPVRLCARCAESADIRAALAHAGQVEIDTDVEASVWRTRALDNRSTLPPILAVHLSCDRCKREAPEVEPFTTYETTEGPVTLCVECDDLLGARRMAREGTYTAPGDIQF